MIKPYAWIITCESGNRYIVFEEEKPVRNKSGGWTTKYSKYTELGDTYCIRQTWEDEPLPLYNEVKIDESLHEPLKNLLAAIDKREKDGMMPELIDFSRLNKAQKKEQAHIILDNLKYCHSRYYNDAQHRYLNEAKALIKELMK